MTPPGDTLGRLAALALIVAAASFAVPEVRAEAPVGQMTWAVHTTLVPTWFDPAETIQGTPFMVLLATHDALVKPMPGRSMAPSLAESWSVSADGLVYEFVLRKGTKFHNGEPVTAEDVKFFFERYRGISAKAIKEKVAAVEIPDPGRVRFLFREQAAELDRAKREAILHRMQQLIHERAMFAPVWDFAFLHGVGPRVEESGLGLLGSYGFSGPYEDVKLKSR